MGSPLDSGEPWFQNVNRQWQLAAISTGVYIEGNWVFGSLTLALRITRYNDWIDCVMGTLVPALSIESVDSATARIEWPSWATVYSLQTSCDVASTNWTAVTTQPTDDGTNKWVFVTQSVPTQFWRLARQPPPGASSTTLSGPANALPTSKAVVLLWNDLLPSVLVPESE